MNAFVTRYFENKRSKKLYRTEIVSIGLLGVINILINASAVLNEVSGSKWQFMLTLLGNFVTATIALNFYLIVLSLASYFAAAAMGIGYNIRVFGRLSVKALFFAPLITFSDTLGFLICGKKLISFGALGMLSYIPFYASAFYLMFLLLPQYMEADKKQRIIISLVGLLALIASTYPYA